ncbi:transposase, partial [Nostoc sp. CHAB 5834]|nr:transposase [Nostoc sp. CHAB 5834]
MPTYKKPSTLATRVLRVRVKDKHAAALRAMACEVNLVWNYCNELGAKVLERERRFISAFEMQKFLNGASKEGLGIGSAVFQEVAAEFVTRRKQFKKRQLRWRVSNRQRANYSLGWIPFKARSLVYKGGQVSFQGVKLSLWDSYGLGDYEFGAGNLCEDARGRWYLNVTVKVPKAPLMSSAEALANVKTSAVGIDLGLKSLLKACDGTEVEAQQFYRDLEPALATAQRARKVKRVRAIHARIANRRKDHLHKLS